MEVVVSAPGKVLITGGYLILERPNAGLVLSTTARFYAIVRPFHEEISPESWSWAWTDVRVTSPQLSREATYKLSLKNSTLQSSSSKDSKNPFVEHAIEYAVAASKLLVPKNNKDAFQKLLLQGLDITILGSNDFYSYRNHIDASGLPLTSDALASIPAFSSITFNEVGPNGIITGSQCKPEVAKTGLGSSAAMTSSVVAALLHYLGVVNLPILVDSMPKEKASEDPDLRLVHTVAQTAHCIAQGKIGSGFDVSAAVYGSQRYIRFSPGVLSPAQDTGGKHLPEAISEILNSKWDHESFGFNLPPLMNLLLGEPGTGGSSTPSMVGAIKKWQKSEPLESRETWNKLSIANSLLEKHLNELTKLSEQWELYSRTINGCSTLTFNKWVEQSGDEYQKSIVKSLLGARDAFLDIRFRMREMGKAAGVPIEPEEQTRLLDATMGMEGVLLAGVPGAGGFDAVFAVTLGEASGPVSGAWTSQRVLPMLVREDPRGVYLESGGDPRVRQVASSFSSSLRLNRAV